MAWLICVSEPGSLLDARAGAGADVQQELPGIHRRKKVLAQRVTSSHEPTQNSQEGIRANGLRCSKQLASSAR